MKTPRFRDRRHPFNTSYNFVVGMIRMNRGSLAAAVKKSNRQADPAVVTKLLVNLHEACRWDNWWCGGSAR